MSGSDQRMHDCYLFCCSTYSSSECMLSRSWLDRIASGITCTSSSVRLAASCSNTVEWVECYQTGSQQATAGPAQELNLLGSCFQLLDAQSVALFDSADLCMNCIAAVSLPMERAGQDRTSLCALVINSARVSIHLQRAGRPQQRPGESLFSATVTVDPAVTAARSQLSATCSYNSVANLQRVAVHNPEETRKLSDLARQSIFQLLLQQRTLQCYLLQVSFDVCQELVVDAGWTIAVLAVTVAHHASLQLGLHAVSMKARSRIRVLG